MDANILFYIEYGPNDKRDRIALVDALVMGRSLSLDIVVSDPMASRIHARFFMKDGLGWVEDLGSSNGSFLNGRRLLEATRISVGDVLSIGQSTFYVERGAKSPAEPIDTPIWIKSIHEVVANLQSDCGSEWDLIQLLYQPPVYTKYELSKQYCALLQSIIKSTNVHIWMSHTSKYNDLKCIVGTNQRLSEDQELYRRVWIEQNIIAMESQLPNVVGRVVTTIPIVFEQVSIGIVEFEAARHNTSAMMNIAVLNQWYATEWTKLQRVNSAESEHLGTDLIRSMQSVLGYHTEHSSWEAFQSRHDILRAVLHCLIQDLGWSSREVLVAETAIVLTDRVHTSEIAMRQRWLAQSSQPFVQSVYETVDGIVKGASGHLVQIVRMTVELVNLCLNESAQTPSTLLKILRTQYDISLCSLNEGKLLDVFALVEALQQQDTETQLFRR